jgi:hypothetical protein
MKNMHNVFLYGKIEPAKLIVAKSSNNTNDNNDNKTPPYFLDFAFKLLKMIKIHAKFIFNIEIAKTNAERVPTIKIESLKKENTQVFTDSYDITNPDNVEISLGEGQSDAYVINEIVDFENNTPQIQIIKTTNQDVSLGIKCIITKYGTHNANKSNNTPDYNYKYRDYFIADMKSLLNKNYKTDDGFSVNIYLEYTKKNANTILIKKINIHTPKK